MINKTQKIEAVFDKDLIKILKDLNIYEDILAGRIRCFFCSKKVNLENIQFIFSKDDEIKVSCDEVSCATKLKEIIKND